MLASIIKNKELLVIFYEYLNLVIYRFLVKQLNQPSTVFEMLDIITNTSSFGSKKCLLAYKCSIKSYHSYVIDKIYISCAKNISKWRLL